jgi:putative colanic acid biosynthesis acetyltransferase WcaF
MTQSTPPQSVPAASDQPRTNPSGFVNPHSRGNRLGRIAWGIAWGLLIRPTPFFMGAWRTWLLRRFGATVSNGRIEGSARIWAPWRLVTGDDVYVDVDVNLYNVFGLRIGNRVVISQGSFLCSATHDYHDPCYRLTGGPIIIEDDVWIAAEAFIGPGVTIGRGSVVGARAVVVKDVPPWSVVAGNPARVIRQRTLAENPAEIAQSG